MAEQWSHILNILMDIQYSRLENVQSPVLAGLERRVCLPILAEVWCDLKYKLRGAWIQINCP
eukprot:c40540_g1_i1 orf=208-393(-)